MSKQSITFTTGYAISQNNFYLSANLDELDSWDRFSRTFIYKHSDRNWSCLDLDGWKVSSVVYQEREGEPSVISLDQEGDIGIFQQNDNQLQQIRLKLNNKIYGQFIQIRIINEHLYACGDAGQVYKNNQNQWEPVGSNLEENPLEVRSGDSAFLDEDHDFVFKKCIYDVNGFDENNLYVCGTKQDDGLIAFFNGKEWVEMDRITPSGLHGITLCPDKKNVLIVGQYGTLLKGNHHDGFKNLKNIGINFTFYNTTFYQEKIYIASEDGLYLYEDMKYSIVPELAHIKGVILVQEKEGILWVLSYKDLIRYDGKNWEFIRQPNNNNGQEELISIHAGERCPKSGYWFTFAKENSRQYFKQGEVFPDFESDWGDVYWQFDGDK